MSAVPKPVADFGDNIADAILDAIDREEPELRDRLLASIKRGDYATERYADRILAKFPREQIEYTIPLVRLGSDRQN